MRIIKYAVLIFFITIVLMQFGQVYPEAAALESPEQEYYGESVEKNIDFAREITLRGVYGADRIYFTVDPYWKIKNAGVHLILSQSQLLDRDASTLTVYINDKPVHSLLLKEIDSSRKQVVLNLEPGSFKAGVNELRMEVYRRISDNLCNDNNNQANWVIIHDNSFLRLELNERKPSGAISQYPYPFLRTSNVKGTGNSVIVVPDHADGEELEAALQVAASLGSYAKDFDLDLNVSTYSQLEAKGMQNFDMIFIGKWKNAPEPFRQMVGQDLVDKAGEGAVIKQGVSPYNSGRMLLCITSAAENGMLGTAGKLFSNKDMLSQIHTDQCILDKNGNIDTNDHEIQSNTTLKELGYAGGINLRGAFRQQASVGIKLPKNRQFLPGTKIQLKFRYSKNLDFKKSLITVFINGTPVTSKKLELAAADGDMLDISIPGDAKRSSYVELRIAFDLEMEGKFCNLRQEEMPWAFVSEDSSIYMPTSPDSAFLFENYPSPFLKDGKFHELTVVIPDQVSPMELDLLFDMFGLFGRERVSNQGRLTVVRDREVKDENRRGNIIAIGSPKEVKFLREMNSSQWFRYDDSFSYFVSNEKRRLVQEFSSSLAAVQMFSSPFDRNFAVLTVTAPAKENIERLRKQLVIQKNVDALIGNATLVDPTGSSVNHYFIPKEGQDISLVKRVVQGDTQGKVFIFVFIFIVVMLVISIVLYRKKYR